MLAILAQLRTAWSVFGDWWKALVGAAVVAAPIFLLGQCSGAHQERERIKVEAAKVVVREADTRVIASEERASDNTRISDREKELSHADDATADGRPSDARLALNCERLRQAGTDIARVPACAGLGGGGQAGSVR